MLWILLLVLLVLALAGGSWRRADYGYVSLGPAAVIVIIILILLLTGNLSL